MMRWLVLMAAPALLHAADYTQQVEQFRAGREKSLRAEDGWLSVAGLFWLKDGDNRAGSNPSLEVPLPASVPASVGVFTLKNGRVDFRPAAGVKLAAKTLKPDTDVLTLGSVKFFVIERSGKFAVRVKDNHSEARREFTHLSWYPIDPSWRIVAKFTKWEKPHTLTFDTVIAGLREEDASPGYATFSKDGREYRLEPTVDENQLFFVFRDQTSGKSTYAAARFLYADMPRSGTVILDFNRAENPPCVLTAYATCPLPPPQNRLPLEVAAGELMYNGHH